ncbi:MAG: Fe-S cluster assembly protein SufD [Chloroflexi bacterium]|jgi:Fe-S cluster assembly protein SufD|nr:Fe-S cluster assembly protein SufD [Chloroflexota bacterium]
MASRTVVTRTRRQVSEVAREFQFTRAMISGLDDPNIPDFVKNYRLAAWDAFEQLPMPTTTDEPWRRTDIRGLQAGSFRLPQPEDAGKLAPVPDHLLQSVIGGELGGQLVESPTGVEIELNPDLARRGVILTDLNTAAREHPQLLEKILGKIVKANEGKFAALAGALTSRGVFIYVPRGVQVEQPLHSLLWGPGTGLAYFSHLLIYVDEGASLTHVHEAASPTEDAQSMHAGIVEIHVAAGANLRFVELQSWGEHVWNFSHERVRVERDGNLDWIFGAMGSRLTKNFSDLDLAGEGASGRVSGFYFADGVQHLDHDTQQNHLAPHTTSDLLYKGALTERSRSVWQGMIYVAPGAQKTDGYQANRNLVLSSTARADSIPGLEILADDVRCTHGATVGKIDPTEVFYLQSRGIPVKEAERLIVEGFFDPIMQRIPFEGVRSRFQKAILDKMGS